MLPAPFDWAVHTPKSLLADKSDSSRPSPLAEEKKTAGKKPAAKVQTGSSENADKSGAETQPGPPRLLLSAFSKVVGTRLYGHSLEHARHLCKVFADEFNEANIGIFDVPVKNGLPFVASAEDKLLPVKHWCTVQALQYWEEEANKAGDDAASLCSRVAAMQRFWKEGVEVRYVECQSLTQWLCMQESAAARDSVRVREHVTDSISLILSMVEADPNSDRDAAFQDGVKQYSAIVAGSLGATRARNATYVLRNLDPANIIKIAKWRCNTNMALANFFRDQYLLGRGLASLKGQEISVGGVIRGLQACAIDMALSRLDQAIVNSEDGILKVRSVNLTAAKLESYCTVLVEAGLCLI